MKVYTQTKKRLPKSKPSSNKLSVQLSHNINQLASLLSPSSDQTHPPSTQEQCLDLAVELVDSLLDPCQCMLLYPLVLDSPCQEPSDPLFSQTTLPQPLHPLLTLYLHHKTPYSTLQIRSRTLIDVFYLYLTQQHLSVFQQWLQGQPKQSLGEWFYSECIGGFYQSLFKQQQAYTQLIVGFLQHGLAYLFLSAASALQQEKIPPKASVREIERIQMQYLQMFIPSE